MFERVENILNKNRLLTNIALWIILYLLWITVFNNHVITFSRSMGIQFCYLVFIALNYYVNIYILIPKLLNEKKFIAFAFLSLGIIALSSWGRAGVAFFINTHFYGIPSTQINFTTLFINSLVNIFIWTECLVAAKLVFDRIKHQRYTESIEKEKVITELNFLKAQNDPHFLFNSLNSVYFQIDKNNKDARETLMRLSEMLRYQLYECSADRIPLDKEVNYLRNYIELQKLRLNKNYTIFFEQPPNLNGAAIAPLLIMPLIENAFKYVSHYIDKTNEVSIRLCLTNSQIECVVRNTIEKIPVIPDASEGGIGLKNLQRRLELLYPGKHTIEINNNETYYTVKLLLHTDEN